MKQVRHKCASTVLETAQNQLNTSTVFLIIHNNCFTKYKLRTMYNGFPMTVATLRYIT